MKLFKRALAGVLTACTMLTTCTACGESTRTAMTIDGVDIPAGVYIYYVVNAYSDAMNTMNEGGEDFADCKTTKDIKKIMKSADIDGIHADEWIQNKAIEYCQTYAAIKKDFKEKNISLTGEEIAQVDEAAVKALEYYGDFFAENGISEESAKSVLRLNMEQQKLWDYYYGEGGEKDIPEQTLYDYYVDNHLRIKYLQMPLKDGEGNLLKSDGKSEIEKMAQDYLDRLEKKKGDEKELNAEFDYLIDEHNNYVTSLSEAAVTTTDENGSTITTETTAKSTTTDEETTTTVVPDSTDTTETTAVNETTAANETTTAPETETTTVTTVTTTAETTDTTFTTPGVGYDTFKENILIVSTAPKEEPKPDETTTQPSYTPCKKVYEWALDASTPLLKPELIKDDENYYIVMKMDIEDRMTEYDLWGEGMIENMRQELYMSEFDDMIEEMGAKLPVDRNEKALKRYKVLDMDVVAYQQAMMQSYYGAAGQAGY